MIVNMHTVALNLSHPRHNVMDQKRETALLTIIRRGGPSRPAAIRQLVDANLKFVVSVARVYINRGLPIDDLINEGAAGMVKAADRFDPEQAGRFISYAVWWIRQAILMAVQEQATNIQTPATHAARAKLKRGQETGNRAMQEEARATLDAHARMRNTDSMDAIIEQGLDFTDPDADTARAVVKWDAQRTVARAMNALDPVDQAIIRRYYGLDHGAEEILEDVGARLGLTRERVRQRKEAAIYRMRRGMAKESAQAAMEAALRF